MDHTKILIVDDDFLLAGLLAQALDAEGYEPIVATSAAMAIEMLRDAQPALVIIDIVMPDMSGLELAEIVNQQFEVPFMFLSAASDKRSVMHASASGAVGFLAKPFDITKIGPSVQTALACAKEIRMLREGFVRASSDLDAVIPTAVGVLMGRFQKSQAEARSLLLTYSVREQTELLQIAHRIVDGRFEPLALTQTPS